MAHSIYGHSGPLECKKYGRVLSRSWIQVFSGNILTPLYLKFETSAPVKIAITCYYILTTNFVTWYKL